MLKSQCFSMHRGYYQENQKLRVLRICAKVIEKLRPTLEVLMRPTIRGCE